MDRRGDSSRFLTTSLPLLFDLYFPGDKLDAFLLLYEAVGDRRVVGDDDETNDLNKNGTLMAPVSEAADGVSGGFDIRAAIGRPRFPESEELVEALLSDSAFDDDAVVVLGFLLIGLLETADAKRLGRSASADLALDLIDVGVLGFHDRLAVLKSSRRPLEYCFVGVDAMVATRDVRMLELV